MYSAKKVNGKKLYELARAGKQIEREASLIFMKEIEILEMNLPELKLRVHCSKGSYIRTLCHDIGKKLQVGAVMTSLERTRVGQFQLKDSITLKELEELRDMNQVEAHILPTDIVFEEYTAVHVLPEFQRLIENGNGLFLTFIKEKQEFLDGETVRVYDESDKFFGLYRYDQEKQMLKTWKMFL
jgi:tRNA pseudouridine55 synthase